MVARAYKFNSPQDWVLTLWQHILEVSSQFRIGLGGRAVARGVDVMQDYARGVQNEVVFSEEHLEQVCVLMHDLSILHALWT